MKVVFYKSTKNNLGEAFELPVYSYPLERCGDETLILSKAKEALEKEFRVNSWEEVAERFTVEE